MVYKRVALRYEERTGGTFSEPEFRVDAYLPHDVNNVKVCLEGLFLTTGKDNTANPYYVSVGLKGISFPNSLVSVNGFSQYDGNLGRVSFVDHSGHSTEQVYNLNPVYNEVVGNLLLVPNQLFKGSTLKFELNYGDDKSKPIVALGNIKDNYCIVLGLYCDDDNEGY
jgi:hypothetical protein